MNKSNSILDGFHAWLRQQGSTVRSADSFCSAIRRINETYFVPRMGKDLMKELPRSVGGGNVSGWLMCLEGFLGLDIEKAHGARKKFLQDKRSKLRKFVEYIEKLEEENSENIFEGYITTTFTEDLKLYDRTQIGDFLMKRIVAEAGKRDEGSEVLPLRNIGLMFEVVAKGKNAELMHKLGIENRKGEVPDFRRIYRSWLRMMADRVIFPTGAGEYPFSEVESMVIDEESVSAYIIVKGHRLQIGTLTAERRFKPKKVSSITKLGIRFSPTLKDVIYGDRDRYRAIGRLKSILHRTGGTPTFEEVAPLLPGVMVELRLLMTDLKLRIK